LHGSQCAGFDSAHPDFDAFFQQPAMLLNPEKQEDRTQCEK
jgi:hypothetical protein